MDKTDEIIKILEEWGIVKADKDRLIGEDMTVMAAAEDINALFEKKKDMPLEPQNDE